MNQRNNVKMNPEEIRAFLAEERTVTMCTMHPDGSIHAVAMWYGFVDGTIAIETRAKSQKAKNIQRDPRITFLVESGELYEELRGVELCGQARTIEDPDKAWAFGLSMWERNRTHVAPYSEENRSEIEAIIRNRVIFSIDIEKTASWDHRKLAAIS